MLRCNKPFDQITETCECHLLLGKRSTHQQHRTVHGYVPLIHPRATRCAAPIHAQFNCIHPRAIHPYCCTHLLSTHPTGEVSTAAQDLVCVTRESLAAAIAVCGPGVPFRDIGAAISSVADRAGEDTSRGPWRLITDMQPRRDTNVLCVYY
jgi:hypothetical protein